MKRDGVDFSSDDLAGLYAGLSMVRERHELAQTIEYILEFESDDQVAKGLRRALAVIGPDHESTFSLIDDCLLVIRKLMDGDLSAHLGGHRAADRASADQDGEDRPLEHDADGVADHLHVGEVDPLLAQPRTHVEVASDDPEVTAPVAGPERRTDVERDVESEQSVGVHGESFEGDTADQAPTAGGVEPTSSTPGGGAL